MKAVQYVTPGEPVQVVDIPKPVPGPGQVLLKITAAGVCHSDIAVQRMPAERVAAMGLPLTLGHEPVGTIAEFGPGATGEFAVGDSVIVYGPWGCGNCLNCSEGYENYCSEAGRLGIQPPGLGSPGALAEYMIVDSIRHLVPIGDLDPVMAAPLADAALTPYHAIKSAVSKLGAGSTAVVIGVGGLGHLGIQILKALTPATVIGLDLSEEKLALAKRVGADHTLLSNADAVAAVKELTGGRGATAVFDFVGVQPAIDLAVQLTSVRGALVLVGVGGGTAQVGFGVTPYECSVMSPYWGTRQELVEVIELAQRGVLGVETTTYTLDEMPEVYAKFTRDEIVGRAVAVP